jgi:hypothetical protein
VSLPTLPRRPAVLAALLAALAAPYAAAQNPIFSGPGKAPAGEKPEFPPFDQVTKGYEKVVSTTDGLPPLYTLWVDKKTGGVLADLPPD